MDNRAIAGRSAPTRVVMFVISVARWLLFAGMLLMLSPYVLLFFDNARGYAGAVQVLRYREQVVRAATPLLQEYVPTRIGGKDRTDLVLLGGFFVLSIVLGSVRARVVRHDAQRRMRAAVADWKKSMKVREGSREAAAVNARFQELEKSKTVDRAELLRAFAEAKRNLDAMGREVAFLSVDVVGSTEMKEREERATVQYDFVEYRKLVEKVFAEQGVLKSTWTPDGVMACFPDIERAILAGKSLILRLEDFNRTVKLMKRDFQVRCGVNAGYVHFDDNTPLEQMSDRVIDIAGHMQKCAEPGTVAVARKVIEPLHNLDGFEATSKIVDGYEVSSWGTTKAAAPVGTRAGS